MQLKSQYYLQPDFGLILAQEQVLKSWGNNFGLKW
jgi:hypothetical protein